MKFLERRRLRKMVRHVLHDARHARNMREDVAPAASADLEKAETALRDAWRAGRPREEVEAAAERVGGVLDRVFPARSFPTVREYVEIIAVAVAVAMGFRTYFVQPFKIPTGSMQPTLYGITVQAQSRPTWQDSFPIKLINLALFGERYVEVRARASGLVDEHYDMGEESYRFVVGGVPHTIQRNMTIYFQPGRTRVEKGQLLASGRVRLGDHIFVNKVRYNFVRPTRGDIFVFSTTGIPYSRIRPDSFYIKRLAGLPTEEISLDPPYLVVNGQRITSPYPFARLVNDLEDGYVGYQLPAGDATTPMLLGHRSDRLRLKETQYLPLGDNTRYSLDGRYFGPVERRNIVGPAFAVYWPLSKRWGLVQ